MSVESTVRDHDLASNAVLETHREASYVAQYRDLGPVQTRDLSVILQCVGQRECIEELREYSHYTEKKAQASLIVEFCDRDTAADAKVAIDELVRLNATSISQTRQPSASKQQKKESEPQLEDFGSPLIPLSRQRAR
jgi:hypothetical protein